MAEQQQPQNDADSQLGARQTHPGQAGADEGDQGHLSPQLDADDATPEKSDRQIAQGTKQTTGLAGQS